MRYLKLWWARWRRNAALEELVMMQRRSDVGPVYLCGLIAHVADLEFEIEAMSA